jgi:signal peptidase II
MISGNKEFIHRLHRWYSDYNAQCVKPVDNVLLISRKERMTEKNAFFIDKLLPFSLSALVVAADQISKSFIAANWEIGTVVKDLFGNGLLEIWHVRNKVIAFSIGRGLPETVRPVLFVVVPLVVLAFLIWYYMTTSEFTRLQRWSVAGIVGGGAGNLIDRIFRPDGVVDFISIKLYGLLGFERWPTFNVADASVVICVFLWLFSILLGSNSWRSKKS